MEKIRIKATGKVYELGNKKQAVEARCSSLSGYVATNSDYEAAEEVIEKYRESDNDRIFAENDWVWTYNFKDEFDQAEENMEERYGDLAEHAQDLINKYDESALMTGLDGCFYCVDTDELYEDSLDEEALGDFADEDDNLFYYVIPEIKFYLPEQVEVFSE
ncbi:hypothetical protein SAMN02746066_04348 [Anaerosporobacter mobilis DSM 15930]|jgi:uncharacterized protein YutD|uniref:Uncharacterized protein n=1 Tax=Anaerosporobacter mobilis DSM 15930 TaxID=1120996 RepID=A0A1M7NAJ6_9FIRM|nr:hypothetical protein [Anaerosporobacter mobilis]SHN00708.1 hypothetical protein SAMN02746066_04348 [Anaerosporobacter mobilis DSM 15930]